MDSSGSTSSCYPTFEIVRASAERSTAWSWRQGGPPGHGKGHHMGPIDIPYQSSMILKSDGILYHTISYYFWWANHRMIYPILREDIPHVCGFYCEIMLHLGVHDQLITATTAAQSSSPWLMLETNLKTDRYRQWGEIPILDCSKREREREIFILYIHTFSSKQIT